MLFCSGVKSKRIAKKIFAGVVGNFFGYYTTTREH
jgi:hypothetical protein